MFFWPRLKWCVFRNWKCHLQNYHKLELESPVERAELAGERLWRWPHKAPYFKAQEPFKSFFHPFFKASDLFCGNSFA